MHMTAESISLRTGEQVTKRTHSEYVVVLVVMTVVVILREGLMMMMLIIMTRVIPTAIT
jgi:hypothetical protein